MLKKKALSLLGAGLIMVSSGIGFAAADGTIGSQEFNEWKTKTAKEWVGQGNRVIYGTSVNGSAGSMMLKKVVAYLPDSTVGRANFTGATPRGSSGVYVYNSDSYYLDVGTVWSKGWSARGALLLK